MKHLRLSLRVRLGRRGIAAVEFALIVPVMLVLFIGTIEIATLYRTSTKLNAVAFNVAQMISLSESVSADTSTPGVTSLNDICQGVAYGLAPFPSGGMTLNIASITQEASLNGLPALSTNPGYTTGATNYDYWEQDSTVNSNGTCSTASTSGAIIGSPTYVNMSSGASTAMLDVPCDNVIIVQASMPYPGIMGVILRTRPTLTQTAYARWAYASTTSELTCSDCTVAQSTNLICNSKNTTATN